MGMQLAAGRAPVAKKKKTIGDHTLNSIADIALTFPVVASYAHPRPGTPEQKQGKRHETKLWHPQGIKTPLEGGHVSHTLWGVS